MFLILVYFFSMNYLWVSQRLSTFRLFLFLNGIFCFQIRFKSNSPKAELYYIILPPNSSFIKQIIFLVFPLGNCLLKL